MNDILEIPPYVAPVKKTETRKTARKKAPAYFPKVSVVIPAYNVANFIVETLDSVLAQTYKNIEIIVINDGSPDTENFEQIIAPYFGKILYLKQPNKGAAAARNAGIKAAQGEILAFLDGDDIWLPDYLEEQVNFLHSSGNEMVYCDAHLFGDDKHNDTYMGRSPSHGPVVTESLISGDCNVITSGTIVLREKVIDCGGFHEDTPRAMEDFDLWFRLVKSGAKVGYQENVLLKYRLRDDSLTGDNLAKAERSVAALGEIKRKHELTAGEEAAWQKQFTRAEKQLNMERGKARLVNEDFKGARTHFAAANKDGKTFKLSLIIVLLALSPKMAQWAFRKFRAVEAQSFAADKK